MAFSDPTLTGLTASFTLPSGMNGKISGFNVGENFRWKDSEGFVDGGFQTGKLTGQGLDGQCVGYVTGSSLGLGTKWENVPMVATAQTGQQISINGTVSNIRWGAKVGENQTFTASFRSNGPYTGF